MSTVPRVIARWLTGGVLASGILASGMVLPAHPAEPVVCTSWSLARGECW